MTLSYRPEFTLTHSIVSKISEISVKEGKLLSSGLAASTRLDLISQAQIDAVHFSTKLEGNPLTYEQVTQALEGHTSKIKSQRDLKEVLNYSKCRKYLTEKAKKGIPLDKKLILEAHRRLLNTIVEGQLKGSYRDTQNVIRDAKTRSIVYLPPEASEVEELMKSLTQWVSHSLTVEKISPLIVASIFHYAFVTIHPFLDGNGRAARVLSNFILVSHNYTISDYASLEKQHELDRNKYYKNLRRLQGQTYYDIPEKISLSPWIDYWLECLNLTYDEAIKRCQNSANENTETLDTRLEKAHQLFKKHKTLKASEYQLLIGLERTQAVADLNTLVDKKIIKKIGGGRSSKYTMC